MFIFFLLLFLWQVCTSRRCTRHGRRTPQASTEAGMSTSATRTLVAIPPRYEGDRHRCDILFVCVFFCERGGVVEQKKQERDERLSVIYFFFCQKAGVAVFFYSHVWFTCRAPFAFYKMYSIYTVYRDRVIVHSTVYRPYLVTGWCFQPVVFFVRHVRAVPVPRRMLPFGFLSLRRLLYSPMLSTNSNTNRKQVKTRHPLFAISHI